jgi:hypothetical protein
VRWDDGHEAVFIPGRGSELIRVDFGRSLIVKCARSYQ